MNINRKIITFILFCLLTTANIQGQVQSFFIPGGGTVKNTGAYGVTRGFCLEVNQPDIGENIINLVNYYGSVTVQYKNNTTKTVSFESLLKKSDNPLIKPVIELKGLDTYGALGFIFNDNNIESITFNNDGVILYRKDNELSLLQKNQRRIQSFLDNKNLFFQAQDEGWQPLFDKYEFKNNSFDFGTSKENKLYMRFKNGAHISGTINDKPFIDIDKLDYSQQNGILIYSHFHDDHINANALEQTLNEGNYRFIVVPKISENIQNNKALNVLRSHIAKEKPVYEDDEIIIIAPNNNKKTGLIAKVEIGNFNCYRFNLEEKIGISLDIYKQRGQTDMNKSSLITKIIHNSISYLSFGDYNNIDGINELVNLSKNNEEYYLAIRDEIDKNYLKLYELKSELEYHYRNLNNNQTTDENDINEFLKLFNKFLSMSINSGMDIEGIKFIQNKVIEDETLPLIYKEHIYYINNIIAQMIQMLNNSKGIYLNGTDAYIHEFKDLLENAFNIAKLIRQHGSELKNYPFLRANVFKWFHHEDAFDIKVDSKKIVDTVKYFNNIIRPNFIMHEKGINQNSFDFVIKELPQEIQIKMQSSENNDKILVSKHKNKEKIAA